MPPRPNPCETAHIRQRSSPVISSSLSDATRNPGLRHLRRPPLKKLLAIAALATVGLTGAAQAGGYGCSYGYAHPTATSRRCTTAPGLAT
jgi:hypothetical protein